MVTALGFTLIFVTLHNTTHNVSVTIDQSTLEAIDIEALRSFLLHYITQHIT
jgi:hypothetical protein